MSIYFNDLLDQCVNEVVDNLFDFDKKAYRFNRDEKDMCPYSVVRKKDSLIMTHNVLGLEKEDLNITVTKGNNEDYLNISGTTKDKITGKTYSINSKLGYNPNEVDVTKATSELKNGILYITIPYKAKEVLPEKGIQIKIK